MKINDLATTNKLLLCLVVPVVFYILKVLSFIFVPFMFAVFIALLFMPLMRWLEKRNVKKWIALIIVTFVIVGSLFVVVKLIQVSAFEINQGKRGLYEKLNVRVNELVLPFKDMLGLTMGGEESSIKQLLESEQIKDVIYGNVGITFSIFTNTLTNVLMTLFFLFLLLAGSLNLNHVFHEMLSRNKMQAVRTYTSIENSISRFLKVKIFVSFLTGLSYGLICYFLDISFPLFWGVFAFAINFVQMIGSIIAVVLASIMAFIEINTPGLLFLAILLFTLMQVIFGSIIEPVMMGKSFSINIIVVLVALMFWGFLWGIPGLILSIPLTVLMKTMFTQFEGTRKIALYMS